MHRRWPQEWTKDFQALLNFYHVIADDEGETVGLYRQKTECFARVPKSIELRSLQVALPLLECSFQLGQGAGREKIRRQLSRLLGPEGRATLDL